MARKGRARRFREARELKQGYDDGLFREGSGTLADVPLDDTDDDERADDEEWDEDDDWEEDDEDDPLRADDDRQVS